MKKTTTITITVLTIVGLITLVPVSESFSLDTPTVQIEQGEEPLDPANESLNEVSEPAGELSEEPDNVAPETLNEVSEPIGEEAENVGQDVVAPETLGEASETADQATEPLQEDSETVEQATEDLPSPPLDEETGFENEEPGQLPLGDREAEGRPIGE